MSRVKDTWVRARHPELVDGDLQHDVIEADQALDLQGRSQAGRR